LRITSILRRVLLAAALLVATGAGAQQAGPLAATRAAADLSFPTAATKPSFFSVPGMALYKPDGDGPFPALVLQHQCGGLRGRGNWQNASMLEWARTALAKGYVVLLVDSLGPRNVETVCMGPAGGVNFARGTRDVLQAAQHVATLPFVDKERIALAGYSWGAMNAVLASSKGWGDALAVEGTRFKAAVALYPGCFTIRPPAGPAYEIARPDLDRPLLVLMGEEDTETPPSDCLPRLEAAKAAGAPVRWHVYPGTTHCFDCKNLNNFRKTDSRGNQVVYRYDEAVTRDAEKRMFEFLDEVLANRR
jgi:dienelactone hydrolase